MSSIEESDSRARPQQQVHWRQLDRRLWVGRSDERSLGTIEHGSRYVYIDADGVAHAGRTTLHEAQDEATGPIDIVRRAASSPDASGQTVRRVLLLGAAALVMTALLWAVGTALLVG